MFALAIDPHAPATIYAASGGGALKFSGGNGGAVFKSTNGGATWQSASGGLPSDAFISLAIDPVTSSTVYAGTKHSGVFKSTDGGGTWTPPAANFAASRVFAIVVDPGTPATLYVGTDTGVFKSTDGAANWTAATSGIGAQPVYALALAIDPATPSTLYAGTANNGIFKSVDGAATWTKASSGLTGTRVFAIAVDPKTPSTLYAGTNASGVFKSTDGAATWKAAASTGTTLCLAIDPVTATTVYAGGVQILKSVDGVATWNRVTGGIPNQAINALAVDPTTPSNVYIGAANGIFKSTNGGVGATAANSGLTAVKILALAVDPAAPATLYAGTDIGLFKSTDGGTRWTHLTVDPNSARVLSLAILPGSSAILAGTDLTNWKSTDGGTSWSQTELGLWPYAFAIDPSSPSTVYAAGGFGATAATLQGGAWKSTDAGSTWTLYGDSNAPLPVFESIVVPTPGGTPIVGTDGGAYGIRIHGGGRYEWVTNGGLGSQIVWALAVDPASPSTLFAGTDYLGLYKSTDSGVSWGTVPSFPATGVYVLKFDPASPSTLWAGTNAGLFRSTDGGATWAPLNAGLPNLLVNAFAIAPGSPATLYVGTFGFGVYRFPTPPAVADFTWAGVPVAGQPVGFTDLSTGSPASWSWTFGDGGVSTAQYPTHTWAAAGSYPVSLTVSNAAGPSTKTQTVTVAPAIAGATLTKVVPVVLDVSGVGGARFSSELTLANRGTTTATLQLTYVPATSLGASGSGTVTETLGPGRQVVIPDAIAYLREKGLAIPTDSNQGGTLFVTFEGLSSDSVAFAGARTTAPSAGGRAGLAYPGVRLDDGFTTLVYLFGLRENAADRSNLALVNMNVAAPIALRVTLYAGDGRSTNLPDIALGPGQWMQIGRVLSSAGYAAGWATVQLVGGPGPYYAYAVFNDNATSDGSFVPAVLIGPGFVQSLPVLVETGTFQSELVLASPYYEPITVSMTYVESLDPSGGAGGVAMETLQPQEQKIIPDALDYLRGKGVAIGAKGAGSYAGAVQIAWTRLGGPAWAFAGARTAAPAASGGQYGLFYRSVVLNEAATGEAWVFGLQQNATNRSNLAVVSVGNINVTDGYRVDVYNGDTGKLAGSSTVRNVSAGGWFQFSPLLPDFGVTNGYAHVIRVSGSSALYAYGVVNDGPTSSSGATNDGSFVAFSNR